ncbi:MAG: hydroxymethylbilane synthase [Dehalogenimonas sp.]|uniref:Porphobilinogen deaminase n=1 Tax=Candidatus Dehalogenimonas loeffleri TaxID=3127115 RepID=A0ABZ2J9C0_9CHLR|nr:hydroxymethylbilane synthase [Dehalogenimonas sp.]
MIQPGIRIGSRASRLALVQAEYIKSRLQQAHPEVAFNIVKISTQGDLNRRVSMGELPGVGFFVKEIEAALMADEVDIAVHSLKDMPADVPPGLALTAVPEREDPRDALISRGHYSLSELPPGAKIGSDSLRRAFQIKAVRPDIQVVSIRGNIETRIKAVDTGQVDAVILAAAGLIRLGWRDRINQYLSLEIFLPPPGQAALGIEIRSGDDRRAALTAAVNHAPTHQAVKAERAFLRRLGGGCRAPIAALGTVDGAVLTLRGTVADESGRTIITDQASGDVSAAEKVGIALAERLLSLGAAQFINKAGE